MICCYHTEAKGQMCKEIILIFLCVALLLSFTLPQIGDYTIRELNYGVQDTTTVVRGTRIACEIIAVSNPGYVVYTIYGRTNRYRMLFWRLRVALIEVPHQCLVMVQMGCDPHGV